MSDYKKTLCLPKTKFPMKANLTQKEPEMLKLWEEMDVYNEMIEAGSDAEFVLHDGPPYANGHIHLGTAMNKTLKDIIVKFKNMQGIKAQYVPGWDCHGLPIEHKVATELEKKGKVLPTLIIRKLCREYARKFLDIQRKEFKRLGGLGTWDNPYLTMKPEYEAATARELGNFMKEGSVYRGKKPIHWCCSCSTALAEAEVEYEDHSSPSIFVRFNMPGEKLDKILDGGLPEGVSANIVIWTTTPWTIPSNMAVAVHPEFEYSVARVGDEAFILASRLLPVCAENFGWESYEVLGTCEGRVLENMVARHPFYDRNSPVVLADYVTLDSGTGCVHTAPGHGREDYETGLRYGLEIMSPLDDNGVFLPTVEFFAGLSVHDANPNVIEKLTEVGALLAQEKISHSYPHCWRCKQPVIFRATTQWFISMEENELRKKALEAINNKVKWIPAWGKERIHGMIENRPDWCISRQRNWGVPITALICGDCDHVFNDADWVYKVVEQYEKHENGCDYWFEAEIEDLIKLGAPEKCPHCGGSNWVKEDDILDVWFDSGTSFAAVVEKRPELSFPADLYLEGSDQHRGWFHSSLLASMGTRGVPPYRTVLTHGYVVDGQGRKMSKSIGNVVAPQEIIDKYGAEILRLWVSAVNYQEDVRISDEILSRLVDTYRRIRNTCRFLLGNLADFNPAEDMVDNEDLLPLDRYALNIVLARHATIKKAYETYEFHKVHHTLHNFCSTDMSAFYLDVIKDRLYVEARDGRPRRSAQTVLYKALMLLIFDMAPILSFTAEEVFRTLPESMQRDEKTVFALRFGDEPASILSEKEKADWDTLMQVRSEVTKAIEPLRREGVVGHSLDTHVTIDAPEEVQALLENPGLDLQEFLIVSKATLNGVEDTAPGFMKSEEIEELKISVAKAGGAKCGRCWRYDESLGTSGEYPDACPRCTAVLLEMNTEG